MHLTSKDFFPRFLLFFSFDGEEVRNFIARRELFFRIFIYYDIFEFLDDSRKRMLEFCVIWLYFYLKFEYFLILKEISFQIKKHWTLPENNEIYMNLCAKGLNLSSVNEKKKPQKSQNSSNNLPLTSSIAQYKKMINLALIEVSKLLSVL